MPEKRAADSASEREHADLSGGVIRLSTIAFVVLQLLLGAALWYGVQKQGDAAARAHLYEDAKSSLLQMLRGTNEIVVTDGSTAARNMLVAALQKVSSMDSAVGFWRALESTKVDWPDLLKRLSAFSIRQHVGTSDVDSLIELGKLSSDTGALIEWLDIEASSAMDSARKMRLFLHVLVVVSVTTILLGTLVYSLIFQRRVTRPLQRAVTVAEKIASGDLTPMSETDLKNSGEASTLMAALAHVSDNLSRLVREVRMEANLVRGDSQQIAQGNSSLSQRTEQQASALEETSASMEEMTATVSKNAESAVKASDLAVSAAGITSRGGDAVHAVVSTMKEIADSSRRIAEIIGVIDNIAFQTNILALNAAVEAARAGEQGRGFAVVASEVRGLAQRSATAAKEIKGLITESVAKVEIGSQQVNIAGHRTKEIIDAVNAVRTLIEGIATASQEQLHGIKQASEAIGQLEEVTQQNAAMVEQSNATAQSQVDRTEALAKMVAVFKTSEREGATRTSSSPAPNALSYSISSRSCEPI